MDQHHRTGKHRRRPSGGGRGGGDRLLPPQVGRAAAPDRGEKTRGRGHARGTAQILRGQDREVVDARRRGVRRAVAAHRHGQTPEDQAARGLQGAQAADCLTRYSTAKDAEETPSQSLTRFGFSSAVNSLPGNTWNTSLRKTVTASCASRSTVRTRRTRSPRPCTRPWLTR